jgi:uncharacterized protein YutE (UPF0331/DUF86 family)
MTPLDAALVRRKLVVIVQNLEDLEAFEGLPLAEYTSDRIRRKAAERLLQELIDAAADANVHILRESSRPPPPDYYSSFIEVGAAGVIPPSLAERIAPAAGLRNRIVHEYDEIDDRIVLEAIPTARRDFRDYIAALEAYLSAHESSPP